MKLFLLLIFITTFQFKILEENIQDMRKKVLEETAKRDDLIKIDEKKNKIEKRNLEDEEDEEDQESDEKEALGESDEKEQKKKRQEKKNFKRCNLDFKYKFTKKDQDDDLDLNGRKASEKIKELCPSIRTTCCSEDDLFSLMDQAQQGMLTNFVENLNYLQKMVSVLKELQDDNINKIIVGSEKEIKECIVNDLDDFKILLRETHDTANELRENYLTYTLAAWENIFRLQCGICDINYSEYFKYKNGANVPYTVAVSGLNEITKFYTNLKNYLPFFRLEKIYQVLNCMYFKKGEGIDVTVLDYPDNFEELLKQNNQSGLVENEKTRKFFEENYAPGGFRDIFFKRFVFLLVNSINNKNAKFQEQKVLAFWSPLDIQDISDKDFKVGNINIDIKEPNEGGYDSGRIRISNSAHSSYTKELNNTINYYKEEKDIILFEKMKGSIVYVFLFVFMVILF